MGNRIRRAPTPTAARDQSSFQANIPAVISVLNTGNDEPAFAYRLDKMQRR